jgi:hypothetical protein
VSSIPRLFILSVISWSLLVSSPSNLIHRAVFLLWKIKQKISVAPNLSLASAILFLSVHPPFLRRHGKYLWVAFLQATSPIFFSPLLFCSEFHCQFCCPLGVAVTFCYCILRPISQELHGCLH